MREGGTYIFGSSVLSKPLTCASWQVFALVLLVIVLRWLVGPFVLPEVASPIREVLRSQMDGHRAAVGYVPEPLPHPVISLGISFQTLRPTSDGCITMSPKVVLFILR